MKEVIIKKEVANQRVDKYVKKFLNDAPLSFIYKTFRKKDIKVNGKWVKENYILQENDVLRIYIKDEQIEEFNKPKSIEKYKNDIDVIYEDSNILIVNKPKGLLIHGDQEEKRITLSNMVLSYLFNKVEFKNDGTGFTPGPCHRLDRNTSGLVVFAKNIKTSQEMMDLFKTHDEIKKTYLALLNGVTDENGKINAPLLKDENEGFVKVSSLANGAKTAITEYKKIKDNDEYSLVEATLITGRTHQLRVHFSYIGHPILGDQKYGNFKENKRFEENFKYRYQFLHAYKLKFGNIEGELNYLSNKEFIGPLAKKDQDILKTLNLLK